MRRFCAGVTAGGAWELFEVLGTRPSLAKCLAAGSERGLGVVPGKDWLPLFLQGIEWAGSPERIERPWSPELAGLMVYSVLRSEGDTPVDAARPARAAHQHQWLGGEGLSRTWTEEELRADLARWAEFGRWVQGELPLEEAS